MPLLASLCCSSRSAAATKCCWCCRCCWCYEVLVVLLSAVVVVVQLATLSEVGDGSPGGVRYNKRSAGVVYTDGLQVQQLPCATHLPPGATAAAVGVLMVALVQVVVVAVV
jgi:hypothetical protein